MALTTKQRKLVKGIAEGKTQREAAKKAGMNEQYASEILKKPEVVETLQQMMAKHGLDDASLLRKHAELLDATKTVTARDAGDEPATGAPDWQARAKGLEMAYKLKGAFTEKREITGPNGGPIEYNDIQRSARIAAILSAAKKRAGK